MLKRKIHLFISISASFTFVIIVSFFLSIGIEFHKTEKNLPALLTHVQTGYIANTLNLLYSRQGNWDNLSRTLRDLTTTLPDFDEGRQLRVVVEDIDGNALYNSFSEIISSSSSLLIVGKSELLSDFVSGMTIGKITLYIEKEYLDRKTVEYLLTSLKDQLLMTLGAIFLALIPAALLSRFISLPLAKLSKASQDIRYGNMVEIQNKYKTVELYNLTDSFNMMAGSLKKQKELRQRLIGDLSHEINTPINIICLDATGIKNRLISTEEGLESIQSEIEKLSKLIKDLDWLAETDNGEIVLNKELCNLEQIIEEEIKKWQSKAEMIHIKLLFKNQTHKTPLLNIDPLRIQLVLKNLIVNCLKYAPDSQKIIVKLYQKKKWTYISIKDQGPGIPPDEITHIFERLYRLETSRNRSTGGQGLGLSIVQNIMEMHNGHIHVNSIANKGSTFTISLPN